MFTQNQKSTIQTVYFHCFFNKTCSQSDMASLVMALLFLLLFGNPLQYYCYYLTITVPYEGFTENSKGKWKLVELFLNWREFVNPVVAY